LATLCTLVSTVCHPAGELQKRRSKIEHGESIKCGCQYRFVVSEYVPRPGQVEIHMLQHQHVSAQGGTPVHGPDAVAAQPRLQHAPRLPPPFKLWVVKKRTEGVSAESIIKRECTCRRWLRPLLHTPARPVGRLLTPPIRMLAGCAETQETSVAAVLQDYPAWSAAQARSMLQLGAIPAPREFFITKQDIYNSDVQRQRDTWRMAADAAESTWRLVEGLFKEKVCALA
jgi:hypothetical protein